VTLGELDPGVVRRHLLALDEALQTLRRHQGKPIGVLATDREERWVVERGLQLCAQNALDVATHVAASAGRDVGDYGAAIERLAELGILPAEFAARFRAVAGFRNVIVHEYVGLDMDRVVTALRDLEPVERFAQIVHQLLVNPEGDKR